MNIFKVYNLMKYISQDITTVKIMNIPITSQSLFKLFCNPSLYPEPQATAYLLSMTTD